MRVHRREQDIAPLPVEIDDLRLKPIDEAGLKRGERDPLRETAGAKVGALLRRGERHIDQRNEPHIIEFGIEILCIALIMERFGNSIFIMRNPDLHNEPSLIRAA